MRKEFDDFANFIRKQGVPGLAVGFIIGGAVSRLVTSLVNDIINPLVGILLGAAGNLTEQYLMIGKAKVAWGNLISNIVDFVIISAVVYYGIKLLRLDSPKENKEETTVKQKTKKK